MHPDTARRKRQGGGGKPATSVSSRDGDRAGGRRVARLVGIAATSAMAAAAVAGMASSPSEADTPGCVSRHELRSVHRPMEMSQVHRVFETEGRLSARDAGWIARYYKMCSVPLSAGHVEATFKRVEGSWELWTKKAVHTR